MEQEPEYNSENQMLEKFSELREFISSFSNYMNLLLDDKPNKLQTTFKSSLVVEFYNLNEEIVTFADKNLLNKQDDIVSLKNADKYLFPLKLQTDFSRLSGHINEKELDKLVFDSQQFIKNHKVNIEIEKNEHQLVNFVLELKIFLLKENLHSFINLGLKTNTFLITDKSKLVYKIINHLKKGLKKENLLKPLGNLVVNNFSFSISKSSADSYICKKIDFLNDVLEDWGFPKVLPEVEYDYSNDFRINTGLHYNQILDYFMKLNVVDKSTNKPIISKEDIMTLVNSNFLSENPAVEKKLLVVNIVKSHLTRFVYEFYKYKDSNDCVGKKTMYVNFLKSNFTLYMDKNSDNLESHFATLPKKYPFISLGK